MSQDSDSSSNYGYRPDRAVCITFIVVFGLTSALHLVQAVWARRWSLLFTAFVCGLTEVMGWSARLWSNINLNSTPAYQMQLATLIIAPTFLLASVFSIFGEMVKILGVQYSRLGPSLYAKIFFSCDIVSLILQGVGGGMAASALDDNGDLDPGTDVMLVGIAMQLVIISCFITLAAEVVYRYLKDKPVRSTAPPVSDADTLIETTRGELTGKRQMILYAILSTTILLFARGIYRMVELSAGWNSDTMHDQLLFTLLDTGLVCVAMFIWNFIHPGWFLRRDNVSSSQRKPEEVEMQKENH